EGSGARPRFGGHTPAPGPLRGRLPGVGELGNKLTTSGRRSWQPASRSHGRWCFFTMWHSGDFPPLLLTPRGRELVPPEACCNARADQGSIGVECSAWSLRNAECSTPRLKRCRPRLGFPSLWYPATSLSPTPCFL